MSATWFDLAPPATWQRFEELCADTFAAEWRDPGLVRYGRTGQRQHGVDIVAASGAVSPLGLQCKQKTRWPPKTLTTADIDAEVVKARSFSPCLKAFYILTTAEADTATTDHAARLTELHRRQRLFPVHVIGWQEICRRATLHPEVARKHFGMFGGVEPAPLLAIFTVEQGRLAEVDEDLQLTILHLQHDLSKFPSGRLAVKQRESAAVAAKLHALPIEGETRAQRRARLDLRDELEALESQEKRVERGLELFLTDQATRHYVSLIWRSIAAPIVRNFVVDQLGPRKSEGPRGHKLRLHSPSDDDIGISVAVSSQHVEEFWNRRKRHQERYGKPLMETVIEMPDAILSEAIVPAILHRLLRCMEDGLTVEDLRARGCLHIGGWRVEASF